MFSDKAQVIATSLAELLEPQTLKLANNVVKGNKSAKEALSNLGANVTPAQAGASALEIGSYLVPLSGAPMGMSAMASGAMGGGAQALGNKGRIGKDDIAPIATRAIIALAVSKLIQGLSNYGGHFGEQPTQGPTIQQATMRNPFTGEIQDHQTAVEQAIRTLNPDVSVTDQPLIRNQIINALNALPKNNWGSKTINMLTPR